MDEPAEYMTYCCAARGNRDLTVVGNWWQSTSSMSSGWGSRLRRRLSVVATARENREESGKARLVPEEFALHSGRIGGATRLAGMGASARVIQREERWSSSAFMVYVRANMEDPQWVSEALSGEEGSKRFPGQGTRWG